MLREAPKKSFVKLHVGVLPWEAPVEMLCEGPQRFSMNVSMSVSGSVGVWDYVNQSLSLSVSVSEWLWRWFSVWGRISDSISMHVSVWLSMGVMLMTHTTQICSVFDIVILSLICWNIFQSSHVHCQHFSSWIHRCLNFMALLPFKLHNFCVILCCNWLKLLHVSPFAWLSMCLAS